MGFGQTVRLGPTDVRLGHTGVRLGHTNRDEQLFRIFGSRILRKISGPVKKKMDPE
jgi:hypothetical protein